MGLIAVAVGKGQIRPVHGSPRANLFGHVVKPMQPAVLLGRRSHLLAEQLGEAAAAQAGVSGNLENAAEVRPAVELRQPVLHRRMQSEATLHATMELALQQPELFGHCRRFPQPVAHSVCQISPVGSHSFLLDRGPLSSRRAYRSPVCFPSS